MAESSENVSPALSPTVSGGFSLWVALPARAVARSTYISKGPDEMLWLLFSPVSTTCTTEGGGR